MLHAARDIQRLLRLVDVVVEVRDARIPLSSASPMLGALLPQSMPVVVALNKADVANTNLTERALKLLGKDRAVALSCGGPHKGRNVDAVVPMCWSLAGPHRRNAQHPMHILVVGVPNAGKSSLINCLRGRSKAAKEGSTPGLTRSVGSFRVSKTPPIYVLDTPGVLAPASTLEDVSGRRLAICGCISTNATENVDIHRWLLEELTGRGMDCSAWTPEAVRRSVFGNSSSVDLNTIALHVLKQFRTGTMGRITLDELT